MKKNIYLFSITVLSTAMLCSCDDFLEPKAKSEFVPKDAQAINELLLGEAYPVNDMTNLERFIHLFDDDIACAPYQEPQIGFNPQQIYAPFTWQGDMWELIRQVNTSNMNIYQTTYRRILGCNAVIDYIDGISDTKENINNVLAQAYALRAFFNFRLVNIFGQPYQLDPQGMGIHIKKTSGIESEALSRNTVQECYDFILNDLHKADSLYKTLPDNMQFPKTFRTSLPMVQLMLSRTYLYIENWEKAVEYAKMVLDNPKLSYLNLAGIPAFDSEDPTKRVYSDLNDMNVNPEIIFPYGSVADMTYGLADWGETAGNRSIHPYFRASSELMACLRETKGDLRFDRYVVRCTWFDVEEPNIDGEIEMSGMPMAFGKMKVSESGRPYQGGSYFGRALKLTEACLNYAEAQVMLGNEDEALNVVNNMRSYRILPEYYKEITKADCPDGVLKFIRDERRRELCFEGHRWWDLRRWGMEEIQHVWHESATSASVYTLHKNDPLFTTPVPDTALEANSELQQIPLGDIPREGVAISLVN